MCRQLQVSRSGFYAWRHHRPSKRFLQDQALSVEVAAVHQRSRRRYGSPRVHAVLKAQGLCHGRKRIARLMRLQGLRARPTRQFTHTTQSKHSLPVAKNVLARRFTTNAPNEAWVSDITYIPTGEGWLFLVAIIDLFSRRVVAWETSDTLDAQFCRDALQTAFQKRRPAPGLVFHSDRGCQYASLEFRQFLVMHEAVLSMSRLADCWDNAVAESFWSTLKAELVELTRFDTRAQAHTAIEEYIEAFYNPVRLHSRLNYVSPVHFELLAVNQRKAA
jgi:transposase InsO family protein